MKKRRGNVGVCVNASFHTSPVHLQVHSSEVESQEALTSSPGRASLQPGELSEHLHNLWPLSGLPHSPVYLCVSGGSGFKFNVNQYSFPNFSCVRTAIRAKSLPVHIKHFLHGPLLEGNLLSFIVAHVSSLLKQFIKRKIRKNLLFSPKWPLAERGKDLRTN